jgi:sugar/nucleoside kinase (ribokinase family)
VILTVGEALMEFRRCSDDGAVATPGGWEGPFPSGAPAIFASVAARLGAPSALAACVGDDAFGRAVVERLRRDGVDVEAVGCRASRCTAVAFVAYRQDGSRDFWFSVPESAAMAIDVAAVAGAAQRADWLHVSGSTLGFAGAPADAVEQAAEIVLRRGGRLSLDPNLRPDASSETRERARRLARAAHVLFPADGELTALALTEEELLAGGALVCHTRGSAGVLLRGTGVGDEPAAVPAPAVREVDATGAGDTFAAGFVVALRGGADPLAAARSGCAIAAHSVTVLGAMEAPVIPA